MKQKLLSPPSMSNIQELRAARGVVKASLTRIETFLASAGTDVNP